jgi:membrane protein
MFKNFLQFFTRDIWSSRFTEISNMKLTTLRQIKIVIIAFRGFHKTRCYLRASALTYYTVLSIVPILALAFGISKGFGLENKLQNQIQERFQGHEAVVEKLITFSNNMLDKTNGGLIAGIGVAILLWSVIKLLSNVEHSFNTIWGVKKQRTIFRQFTDYLSITLICPILLIVSGSFTAKVASGMSGFNLPSYVDVAISTFLPYIMIWLVFAFIYMFIPNCKVKPQAALLPGIIAGTIFCVIQWGYVNFQVGVTRYNAIYGSFAALPLFLVWVQISWVVVLFGAEISFAYQNIKDFEYEENILNISNNLKLLLSIRIIHLIVKGFCNDETPYTSTALSHKIQIPIRLTRELLFELVQSNLLTEIKTDNDKTDAYQPAHTPEKISLFYVIETLNFNKDRDIHFDKSKELKVLEKCLDDFNRTLKNSPSNILLKNI